MRDFAEANVSGRAGSGRSCAGDAAPAAQAATTCCSKVTHNHCSPSHLPPAGVLPPVCHFHHESKHRTAVGPTCAAERCCLHAASLLLVLGTRVPEIHLHVFTSHLAHAQARAVINRLERERYRFL